MFHVYLYFYLLRNQAGRYNLHLTLLFYFLNYLLNHLFLLIQLKDFLILAPLNNHRYLRLIIVTKKLLALTLLSSLIYVVVFVLIFTSLKSALFKACCIVSV